MPATVQLIETTTTLGLEVVSVSVIASATPGPAGPGVPVGGTDGQVLTKTSATNYDTAWEDPTGGGGGAPTDVDYLVGTANGTLSAEIVVGTSPGGELGGTWAAPTVDATHSGSSHAGIQAAAEATAAAALSAHEADTTSIHGIANTANLYSVGGTDVAIADGGTGASTAAGARANLDLEAGTDFPSLATFNDHSARHEEGGADVLAITAGIVDSEAATDGQVLTADGAGAATWETPTGGGSGELLERDIAQTGHGLAVGDIVRHNGTAFVKAQGNSAANAEVVGIVSAVADVNNFTLHYGGRITGLSGLTAGAVYYLDDDTAGLLTSTEPTDAGDISKPVLVADTTTSGYFFNWRGAVNTDMATQAELDAHINDSSAAHAASAISVDSTDLDGTGTDLQTVLEELEDQIDAGGGGAVVLITDTLLAVDTANFDFTSIPSTYTHLRLILQVRGTKSAQNCVPSLRLNNASGASDYEWALHYSNTTNTDSNFLFDSADSLIRVGFCPAASATANRAACITIDIPNYKATTFQKNVIFAGIGMAVGGSNEGYQGRGAGSWFSTAAITRITIFPDTNNWLAGSRASLYGIT